MLVFDDSTLLENSCQFLNIVNSESIKTKTTLQVATSCFNRFNSTLNPIYNPSETDTQGYKHQSKELLALSRPSSLFHLLLNHHRFHWQTFSGQPHHRHYQISESREHHIHPLTVAQATQATVVVCPVRTTRRPKTFICLNNLEGGICAITRRLVMMVQEFDCTRIPCCGTQDNERLRWCLSIKEWVL